MAGDNLQEVLDVLRREMPDVPIDVWARIERLASLRFPAQRIYIPAKKKRQHLEMLAAATEDQAASSVARILGVSVRRVQQLKQLK